MAELDYAFLADFAQVNKDGKLTAVGASYTEVNAVEVPGGHLMYVAGRVRTDFDAPPSSLRIETVAPGNSLRLQLETELSKSQDLAPYGDNKVGIVFAVGVMLPLPVVGLYEVRLDLDGLPVRSLYFTVKVAI